MEESNKMKDMPVNKLMIQMGIPMILSMALQAVYNIVDSAFVGNMKTGSEAALNALTLVFPVQMLMVAVGIGTGVGTNALLARTLGQGNSKKAAKVAGNSLFLGVIIYVVCLLFGIFGAKAYISSQTTDAEVLEMGVSYLRICCVISFGIIFFSLFEKLLQATGRSLYSTIGQVVGAVVNIILDPVFIFGLKMGVVGAGIATVIGEMAAGILCLLYLRRLQSVQLEKGALRPTWPVLKMILQLGLPSLLTQGLTALVQIVLNNLMRVYGEASIYGSDMALSVYGMMMKVYQLAHSMFVGVSSAIQPINGYNFGAKNYQRVRQTYRLATGIAVVISAVWWLVYMVFSRQIAGLFVADNQLYFDCTQHCFRLYMMAFFLYGVHMTTGSFFQGIGKPTRSLLMPLIRQGVLLIPLALVMSRLIGLDGALLAAPVADTVTCLLCVALARTEFRRWEKAGMLSPS